MERSLLIGTIKRWNPEKGAYEPSGSLDLSKPPAEFGGITISTGEGPFYVDPLDTSTSITLQKKEGAPQEPLYIYEMRTSLKEPKKYIVGQSIMKENNFSFSELGDLISLQIYKGNPEKGEHPEMLEIAPATKIGEGSSSPLL